MFPRTILNNKEVYDEATSEYLDSRVEGGSDLIDVLLFVSRDVFCHVTSGRET
jgi:hypothetical protein